jgi:peptide/nickel transport system substrate-binding protein
MIVESDTNLQVVIIVSHKDDDPSIRWATIMRGIMFRKNLVILLLFLCLCCQETRNEPRIRIIIPSPVTSIDPQTTEDIHSLSALSNVYEPLVKFNTNLQITPCLATSWNNPNENSWIFTLRKDVRFQDGKLLEADDVKYSIERGLQDPKSGIRQWIGPIQKVRVVDKNTVELLTSNASPILLSWLTNVFIVPRNFGKTIMRTSNGTGPYRITFWDPDKKLVLTRMNHYWNGTPRWQNAIFTWNADENYRLQMVKKGEADLANIGEIPTKDVPPNIKILEYPAATIAVLGFSLKNVGHNIFMEDAIRKAVALSIDQKVLIDQALYSQATAATQLSPYGTFGFDTTLPPPPVNLKEAKALLLPFQDRLKLPQKLYFGQSGVAIARYLQNRLAEIGIQFELHQVNRTQFDELLFHQDASAYILQFGFPAMDVSDMLYDSFHSLTPDRSFGSMNFAGLSNQNLDRILEASSKEMIPEQRYNLLTQAMRLAMQSNLMIPLCVRSNLFAANPTIQWAGNPNARITLEEIHGAEPTTP